MSQVQPQSNSTETIAELLPRSPLLSSYELGWDGVLVQHHHQPAWETPEHVSLHHTLSIHHLDHTNDSERVLDGKMQTEQLHVGDVALVPADVSHKKSWQGDCSFTLLMLDPAHVSQIAHEATDHASFELLPHFAKADPLIYQIGLALKLELEFNQPSTRLYVDSLITALVAHLIRHYSTGSPEISAPVNGLSHYQLDRALEYIKVHLDQEIHLAELSAAVGMSKFYFCRLFKQSTGVAPYQYVLQQRVERAKQLLRQRRFSLADIALQCGFSNQSHFSRHFKQAVGVTPLAFLKQ